MRRIRREVASVARRLCPALPWRPRFLTPPFRRGSARKPTWRPSPPRGNPFTTGGTATGLAPGQTFGQRYQIISLLGTGGMGPSITSGTPSWACRSAESDSPRFRSACGAGARRRFKRELVLARQVTHTNVIRIHDLGEINGIKYLTMPFVHGRSRAAPRHGRQASTSRVVALARQIVSGLQAAHEAGVVHRDSAPANILIDAEKAVITDWHRAVD